MPSAHAKLSPSASPRWLLCGGSVHAEPAAPDLGSSASFEGTACHYVAQTCLEEDRHPEAFVGMTIKAEEKQEPVVFTEQMATWVDECVSWVRDYLAAHPGALMLTEQEVDIGLAFGLPVDPETGKTAFWGTADVVIVAGSELVVVDFKFGYRFVSIGTEQLSVYAMGFAHRYDAFAFDTVRKVILQPRHDDGQREEVVEMAALDALKAEWAPRVLNALDPAAPRVPGEKQCSFCKARPLCREAHGEAIRLAQVEFSTPEQLTLEDVADVLGKASMIRAHLKACEEFAARMIGAGSSVPGFKLVRAKRNRIWGDVGGAQGLLCEYGVGPDKYLSVPEMCSPAQAEKLLGKKGKSLLEPFITTPLGNPTLAPESDPRPAVTGDFTAWNEEEAA